MKKAQLEIMQTVFVTLIIIGLFAFTIIFVVLMQKSSTDKKMQYFQTLSQAKQSQVLKFLPELQCSFNNIAVSDCLDLLKVVSFKEKVKENELFYKSILGNLNVSVRSFDKSVLKKDMVIYESILQNSSITHFEMPVLLYDVRINKKEFGLLIVDSYG